ncbi:MAG TPA: TonB-dependent receptor [Stellaceae bacterium]|nr:TonB-dependent receptor [Stellaceae bacterium]
MNTRKFLPLLLASFLPGLAAARAEDEAPSADGLDMVVTGQRLDAARIAIEPGLGASSYTITSQAIENQPGGSDAPLNQVLLQAPGVSQDSLASGQLHVRNEHANVQFRLNGVILPEGVSFFGQDLSTRFIDKIDLKTGALPAQYGLRTAGVVDIETKSGLLDPGGSVGIYGGSHGLIEPSLDYGGASGSFNYYLAGDFLTGNAGIENPTPAYNALHDTTRQGHGFLYLDDILDTSSKLNVIGGTFVGRFQIPNNPGQVPVNTVNGLATFDSAALKETQSEQNHYGILSYLQTHEEWSYQLSSFVRYGLTHFTPDPLGDLLFTGIAQNATREALAGGLQADGSYRLAQNHTLRAGLVVQGERSVADTTAEILPGTRPASGAPLTIIDNNAKTGETYSVYLQDEWRVLPGVTINYGGRFDTYHQLITESGVSPRLNAVWQPVPQTTIHAGYAHTFTPPPFDLVNLSTLAKFNGTTGQAPSSGDDPLKAERADIFDVGATQIVLPGLKLGLDLYYKYAHNLLDEGQFGAPIILTPFNYRTGINEGVEFTSAYERGPFSFYGNLAVGQQKASDIVSAQFNFAPDELAFIHDHFIHTDHDQSLTASASISYLWAGTRFSLEMIAGSGLRNTPLGASPNDGSLPTYTQINFGVSHRFEEAPGGPLAIRLDLINGLDTIYKIRDGTGVGVGAPQFGPRRTLFAGIRKEF